jgi:hypothetical protein
MLTTLALALLLNGPVEPRLAVRLSIDQDAGLSALQLRLAIDEVRKIWSDAHVAVNAGRYGDPPLPDEATISLRILLMPLPKDGTERILAWVTPAGSGRSAPLLFVSLAAVTETVFGTVAFDRPVRKLTKALQARLIAQAIGRVAAHELGHYLLQNAGHQNRGLMRPRYLASELVGDWLEPFKVPAPSTWSFVRKLWLSLTFRPMDNSRFRRVSRRPESVY